VYDLGSGDGRLLFAALEKGAARCVGVDIDPEQVKVARETAKSLGVDNKVEFIEADFMEVNLSEASVILGYIFPTASAVLRSKFEKELKPGARVVMEVFFVPGWQPVKESVTNGRSFYFYTMPPEKTKDYETAINTWNYGYDYYDYYLI
jgi:ribosomal protein L11 methylase PrmA